MENLVIVYDIRDDRRRLKVFKLLKDYAFHVQYSVFEATLKQEDAVRLYHKLERLINRSEDSVIFYRQCTACNQKVQRLGVSMEPFGDGIFIVSGSED